MLHINNLEERSSLSSFTIRVHPAVEECDEDSPAAGLDQKQKSAESDRLLRKQSDPPQLESRQAFFSSLKIGTANNHNGISFSTGNASEEPHSAASFSAREACGGSSPAFQS